MRALLIFFTSLLAAAVIATTACESLYDDFIPESDNSVIFLFGTLGTYPGTLGGRIGADAICRGTYEARYGDLEAHNVRAFLSVSPLDQIREMPHNYGVPVDMPVVSPNGTVLALNWPDLLDGFIPMFLSGAGVVPSSQFFWTGDTAGYGTTDDNPAHHCQGWTDAATTGRVGSADANGTGWLSYDAIGCNNTYYLLCIAW
ncbi:MAG: hypothetical protein JXA20_13010 [Spirochaetes bacterium]|nr:hypothetical protein [Spirochaetota bacterium]